MRMHPPLDEELVGMVMAKLALTYGKRFTNGYDAEPATVRANWAHELAGISPEGIAYALANLNPDVCPNVLQFRSIAWGRPQSAPKALPAPPASPEQREAGQRAIRAIAEHLSGQRQGPTDPLAWAYRVLRNPQASKYGRKLASEALTSKGRALP